MTRLKVDLKGRSDKAACRNMIAMNGNREGFIDMLHREEG